MKKQKQKNRHAVALSKMGASKGGHARWAGVGPEARRAAARRAAEMRWGGGVFRWTQAEPVSGGVIVDDARTGRVARRIYEATRAQALKDFDDLGVTYDGSLFPTWEAMDDGHSLRRQAMLQARAAIEAIEAPGGEA